MPKNQLLAHQKKKRTSQKIQPLTVPHLLELKTHSPRINNSFIFLPKHPLKRLSSNRILLKEVVILKSPDDVQVDLIFERRHFLAIDEVVELDLGNYFHSLNLSKHGPDDHPNPIRNAFPKPGFQFLVIRMNKLLHRRHHFTPFFNPSILLLKAVSTRLMLP